MKRIMLIGGYGYEDTGDESQLTASLTSLKSLLPDSDFLVLSDDPKQTRRYHKVKTDFSIRHYLWGSLSEMKRPNPARTENTSNAATANNAIGQIFRIIANMKLLIFALVLIFNAKRLHKNKRTIFLDIERIRFLLNIKNSDLLFNVGGGNLTSFWRSEFHLKCLMFFLCRIFDKPIVLSGQTIGPFSGRLDKWIANYSLNRVNVITLREKTSAHNLHFVSINRPVVAITADDSTHLIPAPIRAIKQIMANEYTSTKRPIIGMNIFGLSLQKTKANLIKGQHLLAKLADYLIEKYNATIVFVPMQYGTTDDRTPAIETIQLMKNRQNAFVLSKKHSDQEIKGLIAQMDVVVGFRYHFVTFAVNSGVPAVGLYSSRYYSTKIRGVLSLVGLESNAINLQDAKFAGLRDLVEQTLHNKEQISHMLINRTEILKCHSLLSIKYAAALLNQPIEKPYNIELAQATHIEQC